MVNVVSITNVSQLDYREQLDSFPNPQDVHTVEERNQLVSSK